MSQQYGLYSSTEHNRYQRPSSDPYNNMTSYNSRQKKQLDRDVLMPGSWNSVRGAQSSMKDDWTKYSLTNEETNRYISGSGAVRFRQMDRDPSGRLFGTRNLLRSQPASACIQHGERPWFNDSSYRQMLSGSSNMSAAEMNSWVGQY